ncbi:MAG: bifunctional adenosylcobinamide kinase/adenosylcobinamide-phosphate guanylyltransferase [Roseicyclus sp.]
MQLPLLTLVIGGAASGKSAFAEKMVRQSGLAKTYVATAEAFDDEMREKIARHRADRSGQGWRTVEAPRHLTRALTTLDTDEVALVDCITLWLTNLMLDETPWQDALDILCDVLEHTATPIVLVSNDVSGGVIPENALARAFQVAQGRTNQRLASQADLVVHVTAGLPRVLKGMHLANAGAGDDGDMWR